MKLRPTRPSSRKRIERREFLGTTAAAMAVPYVITSDALGAEGTPPPSERITTALIGSGGRGQDIIGGGDKVVAVCDVDAKKRAQSKAAIDKSAGNQDCAAYTDFHHVLARNDIDAVVVATPDHWHVPIAMEAIKADKAVYVEKPLSLAIREGRVLADAVSRYGAILQVGSQQRSLESFIKACELVRNGRIGELKTVKVVVYARPGKSDPWSPQPIPPELNYDMWLGPAPWSPYHKNRCHYNFRFVSDYSGGDMTNWGAHHLDIAQMGIGASESGPVEIVGAGKRNASGLHDTFYDINVDMTYANGVKVELRSGGRGSGGRDVGTGHVRFEGTEGWIQVSREKLDAEPNNVLTSRIGPDEIHLGPTASGGTHMGIWLDCIRRRKPGAVNVPAEIGHRSATVCHLANMAMELRRKLNWDPDNEQFIDDQQANRMMWRPMREPWGI